MCSPVNLLLLSGTAKFTAKVTLPDDTEEAWHIKYLRAIYERTGVKC